MLFQNQVVQLDGQRLRLVHIEASQQIAWCIDVDDELAWPESFPYADIESLPVVTPTMGETVDISSSRLEMRDKAWARLQPLLADTAVLLDPRERHFVLDTHAEQIGCSKRTLYKDLRRYWQRGMDKNALLADYDKSGRSRKTTDSGETCITDGRGRKLKSGSQAYQLTQKDASHLASVIDRNYLGSEVFSFTDAYQKLVEKHYCYEDSNLQKHILPPGERPSLRQFRYFLNKNFDIETIKRRRHGDADYAREHRAVLGTVMADCQGVGHYYEIDATVADVYLAAKDDRSKIIGKPTLYLIIDRQSRLVVGFYMGLEHPSWNGALQAILSISESKEALCRHYGVEYDPADWPAHQVMPKEFLGDRGEMISTKSTAIVDGMELTATNTPGQRCEWKPLVECGFKLVHGLLRADTPAYDPPSNATRRRGKHYEKNASLNVREFGQLILDTIIAYNKREIKDYPLSPAELMAGVRPSPIDLWNHGIVTRSGVLRRYEAATIRYALLRKHKATVSERGIEFKGCFYSMPQAIQEKWFEHGRVRRFDVTVSYDTRLVDTVYVHPRNGKGAPMVASLTARSTAYAGLSFDEVRYLELLREAVRYESGEQRLSNAIELSRKIQPTVAHATKLMKAQVKGATRTARKASIKPQREAERLRERQSLAVIEDGFSTTGVHDMATPAQVVSLPLNTAPPPNRMAEKLAAARANIL